MRIRFTRKATADLRAAHKHIRKDSPAAAGRLLTHLDETLELLASGLVNGKDVTLKDGTRVKSWSLPPYRIYYRSVGDELEVLRFYHQARRPIEQ